MPKVSVSFDVHDVNFPIHKLVEQVNKVEGGYLPTIFF